MIEVCRSNKWNKDQWTNHASGFLDVAVTLAQDPADGTVTEDSGSDDSGRGVGSEHEDAPAAPEDPTARLDTPPGFLDGISEEDGEGNDTPDIVWYKPPVARGLEG